MYVGTQYEPPTGGDDYLRHLKQLGVDHVCSAPSGPPSSWTVDHLKQHRERIESFELTLDLIQLAHIGIAPGNHFPAIMLGTPERDREIEQVCEAIRVAAEAGIPAMKYYLSYLGVVSTSPVEGRGGSTNRSFVYAEAEQEPLTEAGGVDRVMGSVDGLKRFIEIAENPYHGLNFCQGTVCEMLDKPGEEIFDIIRYFGERDKIFNVHFRNIRGGFCNFVETFPDEGDVDEGLQGGGLQVHAHARPRADHFGA